MTFDEGEYTVIGTLPSQYWQVGSISSFEQCDNFGFEPVIGFLIVRHDRGGGMFDVDTYPLTCHGARTEKADQVLKYPHGTIWLDGKEFATERECQGYVRKLKAKRKAKKADVAEVPTSGVHA
jgi:hypothetical protein